MQVKTLALCTVAFAGLAAPLQAQAPATPDPAAPAQTAAVDDADTIVVTGLRRSLNSAQGIKRNSDQIVDAVVAEDIGKLPDVNVSESLARITGVQVNRANGEAGGVLIRGLQDFTTTYNGHDIFTAEARSVATQDFPAGGVAALEVYKSSTANQVESGLAGLINVRSRRPFDFEGLEIAGAGNVTYADQSRKTDYNGNLLVSDRWETGIGEFGALINVSYTKLRYLDSIRFDSAVVPTSGAGQSTTAPFRYPDAVGVLYNQGNRERPSVNASLQWRPAPELEIYADALFQGFRRDVSDRRLFVPLFGNAQFTDVVLRPGSNSAQSLTSTGQEAPNMFQGATKEKTDTYQFAVGAILTRDRFKLSADVARTDSKFSQSLLSLDTGFVRSPTVVANFDVPRSDGGVEFSFPDFDVTNAANFEYRGLFDRFLVAKGDDIQARADLDFETRISFLPKFQIGVRYVDRNGSNTAGDRYSTLGAGTPLTALPFEIGLVQSGFRGSDIQPTRTWVGPTASSIRGNIAELRDFAGYPAGSPPADPLQGFEANEKSYAAYGQVRYEFDLGVPVDGVVGLRYVETRNQLSGTSRVDTGSGIALVPINGRSSYTDYLPSATIRAKFTDELQLRASYNQTRTRPTFLQLRPSLTINPPGGESFRTASGGNPGLQPIQSNNYDASLEYYFSQTGSATVGIFRRDITGFISNFQVFTQDPTLGLLRIDRPENGGSGRLEGVEAQFTSFLDFEFLPEWVRGFGFQGNFTYIKGDQGLPAAFGGVITERFGFGGVSKYTYNLVGLYERGGVSARLAYNNRSKFPVGYELIEGSRFAGEFTNSIARLDFSASFTPFENITVAADVSNILGKPFRNFRNYSLTESYPRDVRYEVRVFSLGVRFRI